MKRSLSVWSVLAVAAVVLTAMPWTAAMTATGTVNGSVMHAGRPVAGVRVVIDSASDSRYGASTYTDAQGAFGFSNVPVGEVHVRTYDADSNLLASGNGELKEQGETITVALDITP